MTNHVLITAAAVTFLAVATLGAPNAVAQTPVPSVGVIPDVEGARDRPDRSRTYKLAFDVKSMASSADSVSPALIATARVLNTLRAHGVPANQIEATAIFHGPTIALVTKNETYRARTGAKENPNIPILRDLKAAGVNLVICGVSAREQNYVIGDIIPEAAMNLSATMTFIDLGMRGFVTVDR